MEENIENVLDILRSYNNNIGEYQMHAVSPTTFHFSVKLNNGRITVTNTATQDYPYVMDESIQYMLKTFIQN